MAFIKTNIKQAKTSKSKRVKKPPLRGIKAHYVGLMIISLIVIGSFALTSTRETRDSSAATGNPPVIGGATSPSGYKLIWSDEFNGSSVDGSRWNQYNNSNYGSGSNSDMCYFAANNTVSGGQLHLSAKKQTVTCGGTNPDTGNKTYYITSGAVTTRSVSGGGEKMAFTKGYIEASVRLPLGNPYWGAFWLVGGAGAPGWPQYGEFDIMEQLGTYPDSIIQTLHYACGAAHCQTSGANNFNASNFSAVTSTANKGAALTSSNVASYKGATTSSYVRYGFLWEDNRITWYVNGRPTRSFDGSKITIYTTDSNGNITSSSVINKTFSGVSPSWSQVLNYPHTIILNLAYGGGVASNNGYTGNETATGYNDGNFVGNRPGVMDVDYVRVYQVDTTPPPSTTPPPADTTKPVVLLTAPSSGSVTKGTIQLTAAVNDNVGVSSTTFYVDSAPVGSDTTLAYAVPLDTTKYLKGNHTAYVTARDPAGNIGTSATVTFSVDNSTSAGPGGSSGTVIDSTTPGTANPIPVSGTVEIKPSTPGAKVEVKVDNKPTGTSIDTTKLTDGKHVVTVTENGVTKEHTITVDNPWPLATLNHIVAHPIAYSSGLILALSVPVVWFNRKGLLSRFNGILP